MKDSYCVVYDQCSTILQEGKRRGNNLNYIDENEFLGIWPHASKTMIHIFPYLYIIYLLSILLLQLVQLVSKQLQEKETCDENFNLVWLEN